MKSTAIIANNDKLYVGSDDRYVYAFNAYGDAGGTQIAPDHVSPLLNAPICAGLVAGSDGRVYVGSWTTTGKLYALNADLTLHWEFQSVPGTSLKHVYGAAILGPDGSLYLGDLTGQVFKFPVNTLLMGSVWPAFQRDQARSGNGALNPWPRNPNATITELTPYAFGGYSTAYAVNNAGVVAGVADGYPNYPNWSYAWNAAFWPIGATTPTMNYPWGWNSNSGVAAYGVNDAGDLVGYNSSQAFARYANGTGAYLLSVNTGSESARALTFDASYIVGNDGTRAILWSGGGGSYSGFDWGNLGGSFNTAIATYAYDINYELRVVGRGRTSTTGPLHAFRTAPNTPIHSTSPSADMGTLSGNSADTSAAWAISDSGYVVGSSKTTSGQTRAFRFTGSTYTLYPWMDLGTLGGTFSEAKGVNNLGQVVGTARNSANQSRAFLWVTGQGMIDLNTKLPGGSGWVLTSAEAINDDGWIVGVGTKSGVSRAWLMKPQF